MGTTSLRPEGVVPNLPGVAGAPGAPSAPGLVLEVASSRIALRTVEAGLACCAVEQSAAFDLLDRLGGMRPEAQGTPSDPADTEIDLHVLVVSGTVTDVMAPMIMKIYADLPEPRGVLSFGACAGTGGPYWDSYVVTNGIDQLLPVDVYVPGCPPRPEAFLAGVESLLAAAKPAPGAVAAP